jgi:Fe-S oxidoreductase
MARMKIEATHQYKQYNGHSWRDRLVAHLPEYARHAAAISGLLNLRDRLPGLAWLSEKLLGLSAQRSLPVWQRHHFFNRSTLGVSAAEVLKANKPVVLWVDSFNGHFEPGNALAAFRVLQAAGYSVHIASKHALGHGANQGHLCCGRTYLASGMVDRAKAKAQELIEALLPFAQQGIAIVGLEPSCLYTLRDEALAMGLGPDAHTVAEHALMWEEFLAREAQAQQLEPLKARLQHTLQPIAVHGHCHQKAFGGMDDLLTCIRLIPGAQPKIIETSCCGMAGAFGYEQEHHAASMQMAELSLLPAVRNASDAIIVADGTSCRHQIWDGAQRPAIHVAQLLSDQLKN